MTAYGQFIAVRMMDAWSVIMLLLASQRIISVIEIALITALSGSGVAAENLQARLLRWREHSTAISGSGARTLIERQFTAFDPNYFFEKRRFEPEITAAATEIAENEWGRSLPCSRQIYLEAKWLWSYTAFFGELAELLVSRRRSNLSDKRSQHNLSHRLLPQWPGRSQSCNW